MRINLNSKQYQNLKFKRANVTCFVFRISLLCFLSGILLILTSLLGTVAASTQIHYWEIQSIDTMKYSRDLAREKEGNRVFEIIIESIVKKIASTGATHVAVGTPYDEEFVPYLEKWVKAARNAGLNVWFRGNLSGWEGWFDYPLTSKEEHLRGTVDFILKNPGLFENGDVFTSCTECENGVMGDPRRTGNVGEYRQFLIDEYERTNDAFNKIGKKVKAGYFSMNADVAGLIMDRETTAKLGGIVVIDHYAKDPENIADMVSHISDLSGGKVILGEFGAPIPDIHANMSPDEQNKWISEALSFLSKEVSLTGINYWVSFGGTTAIWNADGSERPAVPIIKNFFTPAILSAKVINEAGESIDAALVVADSKQTYTDEKGGFEVLLNPSLEKIHVNASGYKNKVVGLGEDVVIIILEKESEGLLFRIKKFVYQNIKKLPSFSFFN